MNFTLTVVYRDFNIDISITDFALTDCGEAEYVTESVIARYVWAGQESRIPLPSAFACYLVSQHNLEIIHRGRELL